MFSNSYKGGATSMPYYGRSNLPCRASACCSPKQYCRQSVLRISFCNYFWLVCLHKALLLAAPDQANKRVHASLEPKLSWIKSPQMKRSAFHECMKCNDVKCVWGNPNDCHPFSSTIQNRFTVWKRNAITRVSISGTFDILILATFMICSHFLFGFLFHPNFGSGAVRVRLVPSSRPVAVCTVPLWRFARGSSQETLSFKFGELCRAGTWENEGLALWATNFDTVLICLEADIFIWSQGI